MLLCRPYCSCPTRIQLAAWSTSYRSRSIAENYSGTICLSYKIYHTRNWPAAPKIHNSIDIGRRNILRCDRSRSHGSYSTQTSGWQRKCRRHIDHMKTHRHATERSLSTVQMHGLESLGCNTCVTILQRLREVPLYKATAYCPLSNS